MTAEKLRTVLAVGETIAVEFKRCGNGIGADTYETICAFLNRFGGDIYLGVEDDGTVCGIPKNAAPTLIKNLIGVVGNPEMINPTVYLAPEIVEYEGKWIVHVHVPPSSEVHSCKRTIYDRVDDADIKVTATSRIALLYIRKQSIFTEKRVYPYVREEDLRFDLLPRVRRMAINRFPGHPWKDLSDADLLQSAGLHGEDKATGERGYNLAAVMLLGSDTLIRSVVPAYRTDAIVRKVNVDRYDDRLLVTTNLIDSNEQLMGFAEKHLWDKFYIEGDARISLRSAIAREMLVNTLIHREFTSAYIAKFVIEKDKMYVENANRAVKCGAITLEDYEPNPKNPIIAAFFRNIGLADELGSGVRNLCKYGRRYSGKDPALIDGDVFRIIVPLDDGYSFDAESVKAQIKRNLSAKCVLAETVETAEFQVEPQDEAQDKAQVEAGSKAQSKAQNKAQVKRGLDEGCAPAETAETVEFQAKSQDKAQNKAQVEAGSKAQNKAQVKRSLDEGCAPAETAVLSFLRKNPQATQADTAKAVGKSRRAVQGTFAVLKAKGLLVREGARKNGRWLAK